MSARGVVLHSEGARGGATHHICIYAHALRRAVHGARGAMYTSTTCWDGVGESLALVVRIVRTVLELVR